MIVERNKRRKEEMINNKGSKEGRKDGKKEEERKRVGSCPQGMYLLINFVVTLLGCINKVLIN